MLSADTIELAASKDMCRVAEPNIFSSTGSLPYPIVFSVQAAPGKRRFNPRWEASDVFVVENIEPVAGFCFFLIQNHIYLVQADF